MPGVNISLPCAAYTGDQPFAFISYAHLDAEAVYPEIQRLDLMGYRIWYDEGIDPGNEWPEEVASALKRCTQFIVFVTQRAIASRNVRNEINYALKLNKPFFAIHLDETDLPPGMDLQMSSIQAIFKWRMSEQTFIRNLERALPRTLGTLVNRQEDDETRSSLQTDPGGVIDLFARTLYSDYQANINASMRRNWHQIAERVRHESLVRSWCLLSMLHMAGYNVVNAKESKAPREFPSDVLELLARLEHDRWARERVDAGWRHGERDDQQRRHPCLVPWNEMPEDLRHYDRNAVRVIPRLLLLAGFEITSIYEDPDRKSLFGFANNTPEGIRQPADGLPKPSA